jgi:carboxyl-terminal processing protease
MNRLSKALALLSFEVLLLVPSCLSPRYEQVVKSSDQYWAEAGLSSKELETLLADQSCGIDRRSFLGCVNAIGAMLERYNKVLEVDGHFRDIKPRDLEVLTSEKKELAKWSLIFDSIQDISKSKFLSNSFFIGKWKQIDNDFVSANERSGVIAQGINAFLSVYKDPHTYILPIAQYEEVIANSEAKQDKLGFIFRRIHGSVVVKKVFEGSPAFLAGLKRSDQILEMNGKNTSELLALRNMSK